MVLEDFWPETRGDALFIPRSLTYVIRSPRVGTPGFLREVREAVWSINSNLPLAGLRTMNDVLQGSLARHSFTLMMLGIAAAVALLLGTVGVYGVIAYVVSQRTRELGVRMVLGAGRGTVIHMVLRQALILAGSGVVIGLGSAYALTRLMSSLLFGISPTDPITYFSVAAVLTAVALLASYLPARRAASMDPMVALREE
jgi:ABC-type antimicrobial peptide transport system permease subunit